MLLRRARARARALRVPTRPKYFIPPRRTAYPVFSEISRRPRLRDRDQRDPGELKFRTLLNVTALPMPEVGREPERQQAR